MRLTKPRLCDQIEPRRTQLQKWADAWVGEIAANIGDVVYTDEKNSIRAVLQEMRRRIEAGDYSHPNEAPVAQRDLLKTD